MNGSPLQSLQENVVLLSQKAMGGHWLQGLQVYGKQGTILHSQLLDPKVVSEVKYFFKSLLWQAHFFCSLFLPSVNVKTLFNISQFVGGLLIGVFFFLHVLWHLITCWRHLSFPWSIKFHWWGSVQTSVWHSLLTPGLISFMKFTMSLRYASSFFLSKITLPNHLFYSGFCWFSSQLLHFFPSFMLSSILLLERAFHLWGLINLFTHFSVSLSISVFQEA